MDEWEAYLKQASSDFFVYELLQKIDSLSECHALHYLQMATEKLAKAVIIKCSKKTVATNHVSLTRIPPMLLRPDLAEKLGYAHNYKAYIAFIKSLSSVFRNIEVLAPANARPIKQMPNVEYPWELHQSWICPADHDFQLLDSFLRQNKAIPMFKLFNVIIEQFSEIF